MPSHDAGELALLATLTALGLARGKSVSEITIMGTFLAVVTDVLFLVTAIMDSEEAAKTKQEEDDKEKEAKETATRLEELEKAVKELKEAGKPSAKQK